MQVYTFSTNMAGCPKCHQDLVCPGRVTVNTGKEIIRTNVGEEGDFFRGYLLDSDGTLVLSNPDPGIVCSVCGHTLEFDRESEED